MRQARNPTMTKAGAPDVAVRTFFALWPDAAARAVLARLAHELAVQAGGKAPAAANVHLTLAFLGEVAPSRVPNLLAMGAAAAATVPPFRLVLDRIGTFRGSGIAWAGASAVPAEMTRLVSWLATALAAGGFVLDPRPFHAHVTLARRCRKRVDVQMAMPIEWPVGRLVLNASELSSDGPRYREIGTWVLGRPIADG
jgi:2'-5' RNA ligase